jgi:hypothetical protein
LESDPNISEYNHHNGTRAYNGGWTTSAWWISFLHGTLVLQSSSTLWSTIIHGTLVYGCTSSIEDNAFIRGKECKVAREVVGGPRGPIVIIVEVFNVRWTRSTILLNKAHYGS